MCESTKYAKDKVIPFFKFSYDLLGVRARDQTNNNRLKRNELVPQRIPQVIKTTTEIIKGFNRIRSLTDHLFCTGDIQTIDYALEVYKQYVDNEDFEPFLYNAFEINLTLRNLKPELETFYSDLEKLTPRLIKFLK